MDETSLVKTKSTDVKESKEEPAPVDKEKSTIEEGKKGMDELAKYAAWLRKQAVIAAANRRDFSH